jgi:hypothetical protein
MRGRQPEEDKIFPKKMQFYAFFHKKRGIFAPLTTNSPYFYGFIYLLTPAVIINFVLLSKCGKAAFHQSKNKTYP